jgi:hypothetical protein
MHQKRQRKPCLCAVLRERVEQLRLADAASRSQRVGCKRFN